ncbi:hypothetical protein PFISCL1PPCAC_7728, partial [Pristionchus fissidentatus]
FSGFSGLTPAQLNALSRMNHSVLIRAPPASEFFKALTGVYLAFFIVAAILTLIVTVVCMKMIVEVFLKIKNEYVQVDLYWLLSSPMVVCWICFLGICFPRSSGVLYAIGLTIVVMALATTCTLFARLYGGRKGLTEYMLSHNRQLEFATKPLCCCCSCLPVMTPTLRNVRLIHLLVDQTPFVRITLAIALIIISMEGSPLNDPAITTLNIIGVVSTLIAVYAAQIIIELGDNDLAESGFDLLFKYMNLAQTVYSLQRFILDQIGRNNGFPELPPMTPETVSTFWFNVAMIGWYTVISISLAIRIRPGKSSLFDEQKYNKSTRTRVTIEQPQITQI